MTNFLAILALGFFLGMRHATDPDHVIAVTTIVSRHRRAGSAALIGALWLKEGFGLPRLAGAASVVAGVAALKL